MWEKTPLSENLNPESSEQPEGIEGRTPPLRPVNGLALVRLLRRPKKEGRFWVPTQAMRGVAHEGEADAPGYRSVGKVEAVSEGFEAAYADLVGRYVVVKPEGGRGAHDGGRRVFYVAEEVLGVVEV